MLIRELKKINKLLKMKPKLDVYISERKIRNRISQLAKAIIDEFKDSTPLTMIYISNGAMIFAADLARKINLPMKLDSISASSYSNKKSSGKVRLVKKMKINLKGENVLVVDDILDTGRTLSCISKFILYQKPAKLKICVLLDKPSRRLTPIKADYCGFTIPDKFVVGYGLDYNELYRNLPFIAII